MDKRIFDNKDQLEKYIKRTNLKNEQYGKYDFENCRFRFDVIFSEILEEFEEEAIFIGANFDRKISFENIVFKAKADFTNCRFGVVANFKKSIFKQEFTANQFNTPTYFNGAEFHSKTFFGNTFEYFDLSNCLFKQKLDFSHKIFKKTFHLNDSIFENEVLFNNSTFEGKINAWNTEFQNGASFEWANFRKKLNLTEAKFEKKCCNFYGANFEENAYFYKTFFARIDLKNTVIEKGVFFLDSNIKKSKRETNRIIKNEFLRHNNRIEALNFHQKEMFAYLTELLRKIAKNIWRFQIVSFFKNLANLAILLFNLLSNGFGLWWFCGLIFLFITTFLVFKWYLQSIGLEFNENFWGYYLQFLNPTHKYDFMQNNQPQFSYFIDFIGRVAASLGIYQTVQAFRKFGRI